MTGRVEVVVGPMFAGKTEELLRRVRRAQVAGRVVEVVSHALDVRRGAGRVSTHFGLAVPSRVASHAAEVADARDPATELLAVDEAQFFGPELTGVVERLADAGVVVVVAGLDVTYDQQPFEPMATLATLAERTDRLLAVCAVCGEDAPFHVRVVVPPSGPADDAAAPTAEHVGGSEKYQARCRTHLDAPPWRGR
ncbi:thymidine kinase [Luteimicrobium xylanilyticum]|uniref:Thymidine kinase n=1 Tax=Luteimicrobium xylanilyticum TaxID=1133546 RepID=A0A5P9QBI1_9MICO|nr:thymidine kinase [Luteimicrobium xylanilyticum]QFU98811.1 Thymidine kinase [Luteimicrobium xylanilyticum]